MAKCRAKDDDSTRRSAARRASLRWWPLLLSLAACSFSAGEDRPEPCPALRSEAHATRPIPADDRAPAGVDGVILVDLPPEEDAPLWEAIGGSGLDTIALVEACRRGAREHRVYSLDEARNDGPEVTGQEKKGRTGP